MGPKHALALLCFFLADAARASEITGIPAIVDGGTIIIKGVTITIDGVAPPQIDQFCLDMNGASWFCGIAARENLQIQFGPHPWTCRNAEPEISRVNIMTCSVGKSDVGAWLTQSGWAISTIDGEAYAAEERNARATRQGLWAGAFVRPEDWDTRTCQTLVLGEARDEALKNGKLCARQVGSFKTCPAEKL